MQNSRDDTRNDEGGLLSFAWKTLAGLLVVTGVIYGGTLLVEWVLPTLPDQARAGTAMPSGASAPRHAGSGGPYAAVPVEPFHAQFKIQPGPDINAHVEAF